MADKFVDPLERAWEESRHFRNSAATFSAFVRIGEILNVAQTEHENESKREWITKIEGIQITEKEVEFIRQEIHRKTLRLHQNLSVPATLTFEEAVAILTNRIQLDLLVHLLQYLHIPVTLELGDLDSELISIMTAPRTESIFRSAQAIAKRNWGLPLRSAWLNWEAIRASANI